MKRLFLLFFSTLLCTAVSAHDFMIDGIYYNITSSTDMSVSVAGSSCSGAVVIPEKVAIDSKEYYVTSIENSAFKSRSDMMSVTIGNSVTKIGFHAFDGCNNLTSVTIPSSLTQIAGAAFRHCYNLISVHINDLSAWCKIMMYDEKANPLCYGAHLYLNDEKITNLVIPDDVTYINNDTFSGCTSITSVTIPKSVSIIGSFAFYGCSGLTSITIPNSVTTIRQGAFARCTSINNLNIEKGDTELSLDYIPDTSFGQRVFEGCPLDTLYLGRNLIYDTGSQYRYSPFANNESLSTVIISNLVINIGNNLFYGCSGLKRIKIEDGDNTLSLNNNPFSSCPITNLYIGRNISFNNSSPFSGKTKLSSLTIGNSVTSIGTNAFYGCSGMSSVTIGNSVTSIADNAFSGCSGLMSLIIPNSVTSIGEGAFYNCSGMTSVTIGNSVTSIGNYVFQGCSGLTSVTIPNSVTSIGNYAFQGCSSLTSVTIPNSVTSIGYSAFYGCSGLTSMTIPNSVTSIENYVFQGCSGLTSVTIPNSVTSIGNYAFQGCSGLTSVTIPNSVTSIGNYVFQGCSGLTSVTIPNSVTSIGNYVFQGCSGLTSVTIPNSVTSIGYSAFYGCSGLTSVTIPNSVTSIGGSAFKECSGLKSLRFEDGESTLTFPDNFSNTIDSLYLGRNIAVKSSYFNTGENKLSVLSIGKYVVSLDDKMFYYCNNMTKVISYATEPPIAYPLTFTTDIYGKATLSVPGESMEKYRNADVWKKFSKIEEIDNNPDATEQCVAPVITYADGKLQFACETAGAECKYTLTAKDIQTAFITASNNSVDLTACYDITAYAVAEGYKNSEKVTATLYWINGSDVSTNINQTEMRGVMATCSGGIITVSGLNDGEIVQFYNANGALLYTGTAQNGTISYAPSASGVIIVKIGSTSIKVVS